MASPNTVMERALGKCCRGLAYYVRTQEGLRTGRAPRRGSFFVREDALVVKLNEFLSEHVFGNYRRALLDDRIRDLRGGSPPRCRPKEDPWATDGRLVDGAVDVCRGPRAHHSGGGAATR